MEQVTTHTYRVRLIITQFKCLIMGQRFRHISNYQSPKMFALLIFYEVFMFQYQWFDIGIIYLVYI